MNQDMTCRDFQFEIGKTYTVDNDKTLELCSDSGFHFCLNLEDVFKYYDYSECRLFEVETESKVVTEFDKSVTKTITINRELTQEELSQYKFKQQHLNIYFGNMSDEELLKFKNENYSVRIAIVNKITNLDLMYNMFKNDEYWSVRLAVVNKMTDLDLMFNTFKDDKDWHVRQAVVDKIIDLDLMFKTFKDDDDMGVRKAVVNKMNNLELMYQTFKDDKVSYVRRAVVDKMTDLDLICKTFKDDESLLVREFVERKII